VYDGAVSDDAIPYEQHRKSARVAVDAFVKVTGSDGEFVFRTRDLSEGGLFLYTKVAHTYPFRVGSSLQLDLYDYDESVTCEVVVVRVVQPGSEEANSLPTGFGVRIARIGDDERERLRRMIARAAESGQLS
jgi:hypothetical protein